MAALSVLVCTYNRPEFLAHCLYALIERTEDKPDQVVVVNGGDERADEVMCGYGGNPRLEVRLVKTQNKNLAASRNVGLSHCAGDIVAMTDDDAEVLPDWVTRMKRAHQEHPEAGAVGGRVLAADRTSLVSKIADLTTFPSWAEPCYVRTLPGVNISYKREVVDRVGLQDETLFRGEDVDYNWRVKELGYKILYDPSIKVVHHHRATLSGFLNQHYMYGRAYYLVRRKWGDMYCVYPHRVRRAFDLAKALNFAAAVFYEPFQYARRMGGMGDGLLAYPVLVAQQVAWRGGMMRERAAHLR
ncbi:MAG: glycosyltransferase [Chloroflexi bacterium]|nr:glycosyltransferase [Chloroflexota bacterium]